MGKQIYRYNYDGSQALLYVDAKNSLKLFVNGEQIPLITSNENPSHHHHITPNGEMFLLELNLERRQPVRLFFDGQELLQTQYENPYHRVALDNIRTLSQYPPLGGLSAKDFYQGAIC